MMRGMTAMAIEVDRVDARRAPTDTVVLAHGRVIGSPMRASFMGDGRVMDTLREQMEANPGDSMVALVESWQIVGWN